MSSIMSYIKRISSAKSLDRLYQLRDQINENRRFSDATKKELMTRYLSHRISYYQNIKYKIQF